MLHEWQADGSTFPIAQLETEMGSYTSQLTTITVSFTLLIANYQTLSHLTKDYWLQTNLLFSFYIFRMISYKKQLLQLSVKLLFKIFIQKTKDESYIQVHAILKEIHKFGDFGAA